MSSGTMRAFVISGPNQAAVQEVERPRPDPGLVVVDVERAGICGTDVELFTGEMSYFATGDASYPIRIGHEWCGTVSAVGEGVDRSWIGRRVMGDTMLGDQTCDRCRSGRQYLCENRFEVGIRHGWPGALAEQIAVPDWSLHALPDTIDEVSGALVEPGGNAWRTVDAAGLAAGDRLLIIGPGAIGLLAAMIARAQRADVTLLGRSAASIAFARSLGFDRVTSEDDPPTGLFDAVIDASTGTGSPARAVELVEPGKRVVLIGLSGDPSTIDTRQLVLKDARAIGILSGSPGLDGAIELYADGRVDPRPLVAAVIGLADVAAALAGEHDPRWGDGPKIHVDPRR